MKKKYQQKKQNFFEWDNSKYSKDGSEPSEPESHLNEEKGNSLVTNVNAAWDKGSHHKNDIQSDIDSISKLLQDAY